MPCGARPSRSGAAPERTNMQTPDGRDLAATEWRTIPEFPKYQMTPDGDVRNRHTSKLLSDAQNQRTGAWYYTLWKDMPDGRKKSTTRNYQSLLTATYPEGKP